MGFGDYLSRNPKGKAPDPNVEDNNFIMKTINEITFSLIKNDLTLNEANACNPDIKQINLNDIKTQNQPRRGQNNAFCPNTHKIQSHSFNPHSINPTEFNSQKVNNSLVKLRESQLVAITTRNNPTKETYSISIQKRFRAPNKKPSLQVEIDNPSPKLQVNSSTQT